MNIKAAVFDMDGTLIDSLWFWEMYWEKLGVKFLNTKGFRPSIEDDKAVRTMTFGDAMELIHKNYNIAESGEELLRFGNETIAEFYSNDIGLKAGVREFLEHLKAQGTRMCIATATAPDLVKIAIDQCGIGEYFVSVLSCADFGVGKDIPDIFLAAKELLGSEIEDTWVFEDSLTAVKTAKSIGMKTVGIFDKNNSYGDELRLCADLYIAEGETLEKLL